MQDAERTSLATGVWGEMGVTREDSGRILMQTAESAVGGRRRRGTEEKDCRFLCTR